MGSDSHDRALLPGGASPGAGSPEGASAPPLRKFRQLSPTIGIRAQVLQPSHYKMGPRAMPTQVPTLPDDPSVPANRRAWEVFMKWEKPFLCAFSDNDPVTAGGDRMGSVIPGAKGQPHVTIKGGGHFLQEGRGEQLARVVAHFVKSS